MAIIINFITKFDLDVEGSHDVIIKVLDLSSMSLTVSRMKGDGEVLERSQVTRLLKIVL